MQLLNTTLSAISADLDAQGYKKESQAGDAWLKVKTRVPMGEILWPFARVYIGILENTRKVDYKLSF